MAPPNLLEIAKRLLRQGGPDALTMDALAAAAGLSRATVYRQIGSRQALLHQLADLGIEVGESESARSRTLTAAAQVFARLGFEAATIEAIAEAAGVGPATVYRHFGDKRGLIEAYLSTHTPRHAVWSIAQEPSLDLRADLEQSIATILLRMDTLRDVLPLVLTERMRGSPLFAELAEGPHRTYHAIAALLRFYIDRGELSAQDPEQLARALQGMILSFGILGPMFGLPKAPSPDVAAHFIAGLFLDGARAQPTPVPRRRKQ